MMSGIYANVWRPCEGIIFRHDKLDVTILKENTVWERGSCFFLSVKLKDLDVINITVYWTKTYLF